jgi:single-stranded DNA-binding protein
MVFIQGTINLRIYEDKNHQRQVDLSCMVKDLKLLKKANDNSVENTNKHQEMPTPNTEFVDEGIF